MALNLTDAQGNTWSIDGVGNLRASRPPVGSSFAQPTLDGTSTSLTILGPNGVSTTAFGSAGVATNTTNSHSVTYTFSTPAGLVQVRNAYIGDGFVRMTEVIRNTGTTAQNLQLGLSENIFYDTSTQLAATSSGDLVRGLDDDWVTYSNRFNSNAPHLTHVVSGGQRSPTTLTQFGSDQFTTTFNLSLAPGETKTVVHFYLLNTDATTARTAALRFTTFADPALLAGLTPEELNSIVNFTQEVSSAASATLNYPYQVSLTLTGTGDITGTGNSGNNRIIGNSGSNLLTGLDGLDTLQGGAGNDTMVGGLGNDLYEVDSALDVVLENPGEGMDGVISFVDFDISNKPNLENVFLFGTGATSATGNAQSNALSGDQNPASNTLRGGAGDDFYYVGAGDVAIELPGEGTDTVISSVTWVLQDAFENLWLNGTANLNGTGNEGPNRILGNAGSNSLTGAGGDDTLEGGEGNDTLVGGQGNDLYLVDSIDDVVMETVSGGTDTVSASIDYTIANSIENLSLTGNAYRATGNSLPNVLNGTPRDNLLDGSGGADTMAGQAGNDIYVVDNIGDVVTEGPLSGTDTVRVSIDGHSLAVNVENLEILGLARSATGNELNNRISGNSQANTVSGGLGHDTLLGGDGNDVLNGGDGNDQLVGDIGGAELQSSSAETVISGRSVSINISAPESATGNVTVRGTISSVNLSQSSLNLIYIVDTSGSMDSPFAGRTNVPDQNGDGQANTLMDAAIASYIRLNDSINAAGLGNRVSATLIRFSDGGQIIYSGAPGFDSDRDGMSDVTESLMTLRANGSTSYNAALTLALQQLNSLGSGRNVVFFISDGAPTDGTGYIDTAALIRSLGQSGTTIRAIGTGTGAFENPLDLLDDGTDNNSAIIVLSPEDLDSRLVGTSVFTLGESAWVELYRDGVMVDLIGSDRFSIGPLGMTFTSVPISLANSGTAQIVARLMTVDANGATIETSLPVAIGTSVSNDTLLGGLGDDTLDGGAGPDSLVGGQGNDRYEVDHLGDVLVESPNEGTDLVVSRLSVFTLPVDFENLTLAGSAVRGIGNASSNYMLGNDLANHLGGADGNDTMMGGAGADTLDGGVGADYMIGGDGDDLYIVDSSSDIVQEDFNSTGIDTVALPFSATLGGFVSGEFTSRFFSQIENLTLLDGTGVVAGIGSDVANRLVGNGLGNRLYGLAGNDVLDGRGGIDTLSGGAGDDTYVINDAGDVIIEESGQDLVISELASYTLPDVIENLRLAAGSTALTGIGNAAANVISGNSLGNTLDGGAGSDTLSGEAGDDTYIVDNPADRIVESLDGGTDSVNASSSFILPAHVENLTLLGSSGIGGAGNTLNNRLTGNSGANRLVGYDGNDSLAGGDGDDSLDGGAGNDQLDGGNGTDTASYGGVFSSYRITTDGSTGVTTVVDLSGREGTDRLSQVEFLRFADRTVAVNAAVVAAPLARSSVFMGSADVFTAASSGLTVFGSSAPSDRLSLASGIHSITADQSIDRVVLPAASSQYTFLQVGNQVRVFDSAGNTEVLRVPVQTDSDGTIFEFTDGQVSTSLQAGVIRIGGSALVSGSAALPTALTSPTLGSAAAFTPRASTAAVFMQDNDSVVLVDGSIRIFGRDASEVVTVGTGARDISLDQKVEEIRLPQPSGQYQFKQSGNRLEIFDSGGVPLVAGPIQTDIDGTVVQFGGGESYSVLLRSGVMRIGGVVINPNGPTPLALGGSQPTSASVSITGAGSVVESNTVNTTYTLSGASGTYTYTITGFGSGDKIVGPAGVVPTISNQNSFTDGSVSLQYVVNANIVTVTLTGLSPTQDGAILSATDLNTVFGVGTLS